MKFIIIISDVRKFSDWSKWFRSATTAPLRPIVDVRPHLNDDDNHEVLTEPDGYEEERYQCACVASVLDQSQLSKPYIRIANRYCSADGLDCSEGIDTCLSQMITVD